MIGKRIEFVGDASQIVESLLSERVVLIRQRENDLSKWQQFLQALGSVFNPEEIGDLSPEEMSTMATDDAIEQMKTLMQQYDIVVA